jgi:single-stranded DNA-binding protein
LQVTTARVYVEGVISAEVWTNPEGIARANLKVTSWHAAAVSQIGRRKPRQQQRRNGAAASEAGDPGPSAADFHDDEIGL